MSSPCARGFALGVLALLAGPGLAWGFAWGGHVEAAETTITGVSGDS